MQGPVARKLFSICKLCLGSDVEVTLETVAKSPNGFPTNVVRIVTENARTLKLRTLVLKRTRLGLANEILS
jgi:hypothetical protein